MSETLIAQPLTADAFSPYGDVIEKPGAEQILINRDKCVRHHALSCADVISSKAGDAGKVGISIFAGTPYELPHVLDLVERHPLGSQAFYPLGNDPWLVTVCADEGGRPVKPVAFLATSDQGINIKRGTWHGVLTPLYHPADFLVVDRIGDGDNLEEFTFDNPYQITLGGG